MKVILLESIRSTGEKYEVLDVAPGYAQNYLLPRGKAKPATKANLKELKNKRKKWQDERTKDVKGLTERAKKIEGVEIVVKDKVNDEGRLFGSVDADRIKEVLKDKHGVNRGEVLLKEPIKETGEHEVQLAFSYGIEVKFKVIVKEE